MNRTALNAVLMASAIVLVSLAVWQWRLRQVPEVEPAQRSDYILRNYELTTLGQEGNEAFTVRGPYLQRDIGGKSLSLVQPRFSFPDSTGGRWSARSDKAWVSPKADQVHLIDAVSMVGPPGEGGRRTTFATERLTVFPDTNTASSDERVTVTQGDSILQGSRLRADMKAKRYQLKDSKIRHAPRT
ncbi:LPS export ABC transporter periplasmic protein LptC [Arenimonas sp. MALMAid1274]|uniref:LPS export ABC transporter periplasmic protein LptC n=1 Tax=Arenimonas sp. MALMAid1274 TaxID=3411630 RepID=UPI003BA106EC